MNKIIGIGNALVDALYADADDALINELGLMKGGMQLVDRPTYESISRRMEGAPRKRTTGGSACNTLKALGSLGAEAAVIGKVGRDDNGRFFAESFHEAGVETCLIATDDHTGVASTFITPDAQRTFATYLGSAGDMQPEEIRPEWLQGNATSPTDHTYIYIEGYLVQNHALMDHLIAEAARVENSLVCLDMASYNIVEADHDFFAHLLEHVDIVFANEEEARAFTGKGPEEAVDELAQICRVAVVKMGARGAVVRRGDERVACPAEQGVKVVDTTAAGDYFAAGFLYAHSHGRSLEACLEAGTYLSANIISVVGTQLSGERWEEIRQHVRG